MLCRALPSRPAPRDRIRDLAPILLIALALFGTLGAEGARARVTALDLDWNDVYVPGGEVRDGMLLPGRLILRFAPGATPERVAAKSEGGLLTGQLDLDRAAASIGARSLGPLFATPSLARRTPSDAVLERTWVMEFDPQRQSLRAAAEVLASVGSIEHVEPDVMHRLAVTLPNDPNLDLQWWLRNSAYGGGDIRALAAWHYGTGSADVTVCVADSGVDWQHPDLGGTGPDYTDGVVWINQAELNGTQGVDDDGNGFVDDVRGWDFVTGVSGAQSPPQDVSVPDNDPMDYESHGTSVAGCVSALSDNGIGIASTNWSTRVMACRIGWLPPGADGGVVGMSFAAQSMHYARINGADVYNASWGSSGLDIVVNATNAAVSAGMVIVTAAGNANNMDASYLSSRPDVVSVAATAQSDGKANFSSYGPWVDISAPGVATHTTAYDRYATGEARHTYSSPNGTSFASPIVAGGFAFAKALFPDDTREELVARVLAAVDDIDPVNRGYENMLGSGRLNLGKLFDLPGFWRIPERLPTLIDAMNVCAPGDTLALASDLLLAERLVLPSDKGMTILGGWDPSYTTRDLANGLTEIAPPGGTGSTVKVSAGAGPDLVFDGFRITGGKAGLVSAEPVQARYGGGVLVRDASAVLRNLIVEGNQAGLETELGAGGGIAVLGGSPLFENVVVTGNSARRGAGIYVHRGTPTFRAVLVEDNTSYGALTGDGPLGGGVFVLNAPVETPTSPDGATLVPPSEVVFEDSRIRGHVVDGPGGGIHAENSALRLVRTEVQDNQAAGEGAGIHVADGALTLVGGNVKRNLMAPGTLESGGGIYASASAVSVDSTAVENNTAGFGGGGIAVENATALSLRNTLIANNTAAFFGAGIYANGMPAASVIEGNTVADNDAAQAGAGGMYLIGGDVTLARNLVAFNGTGIGTLADGVAIGGATVTALCNLVHGNGTGNWGGIDDPTDSDGNLDLDPLFCPQDGVYAVTPESPAANAACGIIGHGEVGCSTVSVDDPAPESTPNGPRRVALRQNVPNPFNPLTTIEFSLPAASSVELAVYDLRGRQVRVLARGPHEAGVHRVQWDGTDDAGRHVASGVYLYRLRTEDRMLVRKMGLLE